MATLETRREFLKKVSAAAGAAALAGIVAPGCAAEPEQRATEPTSKPSSPDGRRAPRVVVARDEALSKGRLEEHAERLRKLLDAAVQQVAPSADAASKTPAAKPRRVRGSDADLSSETSGRRRRTRAVGSAVVRDATRRTGTHRK
jgi:hypothetical protein